MRKLMMIATMVTVLVGCKKDNKGEPAATPAAGAAGTPAAGTPGATPPPVDPAAKPVDVPAPPAAGGPRPASITDAHLATADKLVAVMTELGAGLTAAGSDCKKGAAAITAMAPKLAAMETEGEPIKTATANDPAAQQWFMANYAQKLMAPMAPMQQLSQACKDDPDFVAALKAAPMPGRKVKSVSPPPPPASKGP